MSTLARPKLTLADVYAARDRPHLAPWPTRETASARELRRRMQILTPDYKFTGSVAFIDLRRRQKLWLRHLRRLQARDDWERLQREIARVDDDLEAFRQLLTPGSARRVVRDGDTTIPSLLSSVASEPLVRAMSGAYHSDSDSEPGEDDDGERATIAKVRANDKDAGRERKK